MFRRTPWSWCDKAAVSKPAPSDPTPIPTSFTATTGISEQHLDAETRAKIKIAEAIGPESFEENTRHLKNLALRGLRSFVSLAFGIVVFNYAYRKKKRQMEAEEEAARIASGEVDPDDDVAMRYLKEMGALGWDVEGREEELAAEKEKLAKK